MKRPYTKAEASCLINKIENLSFELENATPDPDKYKQAIKAEADNYIRYRIKDSLRKIPTDDLESASDSVFNRLAELGFDNFSDIYCASPKELGREFKIPRKTIIAIKEEVSEAAEDVKENIVLCIDHERVTSASSQIVLLISKYRAAKQLKKECDAILTKFLEGVNNDLPSSRILGSTFKWLFASKSKKENAVYAFENLQNVDIDGCSAAIGKAAQRRRLIDQTSDDAAWGMFNKQPKTYEKILKEAAPGLQFIFGHDLSTMLEIQEIEEWCRLDTEERTSYENAVLTRDVPEMRQVSWTADAIEQSCKAGKLAEIVEEAKQNGEKVIVFSYFMHTLWKIEKSLGDKSMQTITAGTVPNVRVKIAREFDNSAPGTVLPVQITYGEPALNLKTKARVVICEPQLNPYTEKEAINLAFRPGKRRNVQVHYLLCKDSIDVPINNIVKDGMTVSDEEVKEIANSEYTKVAGTEQ